MQGGDLPKDSLVKDIFSSSNKAQESFEYENPMKSKNSMESETAVKFSKGGLLGAKDDARHKASDKLHNRGFDRNKDKAFAALAGYNRSKAILPKAKKVDKGQELDQSGALVLPPLPDSPSEDEEVGFSSRELQLLQEANISADKLLDFVTLLPY